MLYMCVYIAIDTHTHKHTLYIIIAAKPSMKSFVKHSAVFASLSDMLISCFLFWGDNNITFNHVILYLEKVHLTSLSAS